MDNINFDFWTCQVKEGEKTTIKMNSPEDTVHLTMACFGKNVKSHSRTLINIQYGKREAPICVLTQGKHENQMLDLNLPGSKEWSFTISGTIPSTVFLTGYVQPLIDIDQLESLEVEAIKAKKRDLENHEDPTKPKKKIKNKENDAKVLNKSEIREREIGEKEKSDKKNASACKQEKKKKKKVYIPRKRFRNKDHEKRQWAKS